jgi:hypothetical protein
MKDADIIAGLNELGLTVRDQGVLLLVPMAMVAWADGDADVDEMEAIAGRQCNAPNSAEKCVMDIGDSGRKFLRNHFIYRKPDPELCDKLLGLMQESLALLPDERASIYRDLVAEMCADVAHASGGILGIATVSAAEKQVLADLADRLKLRLGLKASDILNDLGV